MIIRTFQFCNLLYKFLLKASFLKKKKKHYFVFIKKHFVSPTDFCRAIFLYPLQKVSQSCPRGMLSYRGNSTDKIKDVRNDLKKKLLRSKDLCYRPKQVGQLAIGYVCLSHCLKPPTWWPSSHSPVYYWSVILIPMNLLWFPVRIIHKCINNSDFIFIDTIIDKNTVQKINKKAHYLKRILDKVPVITKQRETGSGNVRFFFS